VFGLKCLTIILLLFSVFASAHGGRTNSEGCHNSQSEGYHCHNHAAPSVTVVKYDRSQWKHWSDLDGDCQDARAETLIRDSLVEVKFKNNKTCSVDSGKWFDPFTAQTFTLASDIDIDHIVPLKHAHLAGGHSWSKAKKKAFANDPENLLSVEDNANSSKGDQAPHEWMPKNKTFWCTYLSKWNHVKAKYELTYTTEEVNFISRVKEALTCS